MLRKIRLAAALLFFTMITLLFLDFTGTVHGWFGWMAKIQFLPAVLALNVGVVIALVLLTLLLGRVYCSVICPLGVFQDIISWVSGKVKKNRFRYSPALSWLRYGVLAVFVVALVAGVVSLAALIAPYSAYGRIISNLLTPLYQWGNNVLALWAERVDSYAFYSVDVWMKGLSTFAVAVGTVIVLFILAWRGGRTYCNTICPVGTVLGLLSRYSYFKPVIDTSKCNGCGLCALVALLIFQILTPDEALSGFSNSVVIMMVGLFVVGGAIFQTGLAKMISSHILKLAGKSELKLFLLVMLVTSAIGAFVSNTGTVALMLPIVVSLAVSANMNPSRLLMPLAFASSMGGMMTLIGTPPNLVIQNALTSAGFPPLSFFSFFPVGIICVAVGTLVLLPLSKWFLSKRGKNGEDNVHSGKSLKQLVKEYGLSSNLFRLRVVGDSRLHGKTIIELDIRRKYGLNILEVRRGDMSQHRFLKTITQKLADPGTVLQKEDILYVTGDFEKIKLFAEDYLLEMLDEHTTEEAKNSANSLDFYDIGIAEIVLMPSSNLINQTIKGAGFRDKFNVNVLGIRRKKEYLLQDLGNERIHSGDVLLVQGTWNNIARLSKEDADWVVLGQPLAEAAKVTLDYKAPVAAVIMVLMVAMMVFDFIPVAPVTAVMIAGILMVLTGCFRNVEAAYKTINWESIVLIAAMLPMSLALEKTGASEYISNSLVSELGTYGPLALMAGIYFTTSLMTMFISNTATAVLLAPIAMQSATQIGVSPVPFLFAVTLGASMCFASPFSTPPNALVMPAGQYTFMDYVKVGLPLQIIMGIVMVLVLPLLFPF